jgi:hypothetical protein
VTATPRLGFLPDSTSFLETWPISGSLRSGAVSARTTLELPTFASGCSSWPTPTAMNPNETEDLGSWEARHQRNIAKHSNGNGQGMPLGVAVRLWPTPTAERVGNRMDTTISGDGRETPNKLGWAVAMWPTARANDGEKRGNVTPDHRSGLIGASTLWRTPQAMVAEAKRTDGRIPSDPQVGLADQVRMWATPRASANENRTTRHAPSHGHGHGETLAGQSNAWPTPTAHDAKATAPSQMNRNSLMLVEAASSFPPDATTSTDGDICSTPTRVLNPRFAEILMGWPAGWTDSESSVTDAYRSWLRWHTCALRTVLGSEP